MLTYGDHILNSDLVNECFSLFPDSLAISLSTNGEVRRENRPKRVAFRSGKHAVLDAFHCAAQSLFGPNTAYKPFEHHTYHIRNCSCRGTTMVRSSSGKLTRCGRCSMRNP